MKNGIVLEKLLHKQFLQIPYYKMLKVFLPHSIINPLSEYEMCYIRGWKLNQLLANYITELFNTYMEIAINIWLLLSPNY